MTLRRVTVLSSSAQRAVQDLDSVVRIMIDRYTWVTYSFRSPYFCAYRAGDTSVISVRTWPSQLHHHDCVSPARVVDVASRECRWSPSRILLLSLIVHSSTDSLRFFRHCISCVVIVPTVGFVLLCAIDFALACTVGCTHSSTGDFLLTTAVDYDLSTTTDYTLSFPCRVLRVLFLVSLSRGLWLSLHALLVIQTSS